MQPYKTPAETEFVLQLNSRPLLLNSIAKSKLQVTSTLKRVIYE